MKNFNRGFTLIEVLVTIIIMAILGILIVQSFITTITASSKTEILKDIKQNGDFVIDVLTRKIRNARSLDCHTGLNQILVTNPDDSQSLFHSATQGGACRIVQIDTPLSGPVVTSYLTTTNLTLIPVSGNCLNAALVVNTCEQIASQDAKVTVEFSLEQNNPTATKFYEKGNQKFVTTISLRNVQY